MALDGSLADNLANWNERTAIHAASSSYGLERYVTDPGHLSGVVAHDAPALGDLTGCRAVHLQCHIGTDTLSLARLGATVTGVDFSAAALDEARGLFERCGSPGRFVESTVTDAPATLGERFDLVYTGVGSLNWLPDIASWARVVSELLVTDGRLYVRDGHPALFALDDERSDDQLVPLHSYFETVEPLVADQAGTYTDGDVAQRTHTRSAEWNHGIGEIVTALIDAGMRIDRLVEHREAEWQALDHMVESGGGRWRLPDDQHGRVPLMFSILATRVATATSAVAT